MSDLKDFVIENGVLKKYVGEGGDVTFPNNVIKVGKNAFSNCKTLTSVTFPESLKEIERCAFYGCAALESAIVPNNVRKIGWGAFCDCKKLVDENGYHIICHTLHNYCDNVTHVSVPDHVTEIGYGAFLNNNSLESVILPNSVTKVQARAFWNCTSLASIIFSSALSKIEASTFLGCTSLSTVSIPEGITEIENRAFGECKALSTIVVPESLTTVCKEAFKGCEQLDTIIAPSKNAFDVVWKVLTKKQKLAVLRKAILEKKVDDNILSKIKINKNLLIELAIKNDEVELVSKVFELFQKVDIETLDKSIAVAKHTPQVIAFLMEYKQRHYTTEQLEKAENNKIEKTLGLKEKTISDWKKIYTCEKCKGGISIKNYKGTECNVEIPETIGKDKVVAVGCDSFSPQAQRLTDEAIKLRNSIKTIIFPSSIRWIYPCAFSNCKSLSSITLSNNLVEIRRCAFYECVSLASISIPDKVKLIGPSAFYGCGSLSSIALPENLFEIGYEAFGECTALTSIIIPNQVRTIAYRTFYNCIFLKSITIPDSVTEIAQAAFENCPNLTIHAPAGSYAEQYAKENNIPFVAE